MNILGCDIRWPGFSVITKAAAFSTALWAVIIMADTPLPEGFNPVFILISIAWGCISNELGISLRKGSGHWVVFISVLFLLIIAEKLVASI